MIMILIMVLVLAMILNPSTIPSTSFFLGLPFSYLQFELMDLPKCHLPINKIITLGQLDFCPRQQYCLVNTSILTFRNQALLRGSLFLCPIGMSTPLVISIAHRLR